MHLSEHRFLRFFPPDEAKRLARSAETITFPAATVIFEENDRSDVVYLVLDGQVELLKHSSAGHYLTLAYAGENDYFGELGVIDGSGRSARAQTLTEVTAAMLPKATFLDVLSKSPVKTTMGLFLNVIENLRAANARFVREQIRKEKITLIGEMANSILHDFKNPVTSIQLAVGLIAKRHQDEVSQQACGTIVKQLRRMGSMVEEVLEFARGDTRLDLRPVAVAELLHGLLSLNAETLGVSGVTVEVRAGNLTVMVDHDRMIRVLQNLLTNSLEALRQRRGGRVVLAARRHARGCEISVRDNGPGIPKVVQGTLFQPFVTHGKTGNTGLGLAIAKGIVEAHRGEISFESSKGAGTTFRVWLPGPPRP